MILLTESGGSVNLKLAKNVNLKLLWIALTRALRNFAERVLSLSLNNELFNHFLFIMKPPLAIFIIFRVVLNVVNSIYRNTALYLIKKIYKGTLETVSKPSFDDCVGVNCCYFVKSTLVIYIHGKSSTVI